MPSWIGPTVALSLLVIALAFAAIGVAVFMIARKTSTETQHLVAELSEFRRELTPTIQAVNRLVAGTSDLTEKVRDEVLAVLNTSRQVRRGVDRGARRLRVRLEDLDALYEVVHEEVKDTALEVAATLRTVRHGSGVISQIRRFLRRGRR